MFESFGFVSGVFLGLVLGACVAIVAVALMNMGSDTVNDIMIKASYQMPIGYFLVIYVYHGSIKIKVNHVNSGDTGYVDCLDYELDARLLLAEAHAVNFEKQNLEEVVQDQVAA